MLLSPSSHIADVAELVDAADSKSAAFGCMGSSPIIGISLLHKELERFKLSFNKNKIKGNSP